MMDKEAVYIHLQKEYNLYAWPSVWHYQYQRSNCRQQTKKELIIL
jgi:hypothetical protein